jgi:predicted HAD superfamily phosphohydrolase YqeG
MRLLDATPAETAVIGDQLFTDILGGNLLGLTTVLVVPLSQRDLPHTVLLRLIERRIMTDREPLA